jgi:tetratricopeptide (TPR) repeat protein
VLAALPAQAQPAVEAARYERCMALARSDPEAARGLAETWRLDGGGSPAEHCAAVARIGLGDYAEAARRLETLADELARGPVELRAEVLGQAGQAWLLADSPPRAHAALTQALALRPENLDLLTDRAVAAAALGRPAEALDDLDRVLARDGDRVDARIFRASAQRALGDLEAALEDAARALELAPDHPDGLLERGNIRRVMGDAAGARRDWERLLETAPESAAATAARINLDRLGRGHRLRNRDRRSAPAAAGRGGGRPAAGGSSAGSSPAHTTPSPARARPRARRRDSRSSRDAPPR